MSAVEDMERRLSRAQAVDEAYQALEKYQINHRRVVFAVNDQKRAGGYGIVRRAHLHASAYLPTWLASRQYGPPLVVAVKEIKLSSMHDASDLKRAFTKELLIWSRLEGHPGVARFLGFCADFGRSEAWLISPWVAYGNVSEFIHGHGALEVPEKLSLAYDTIDALAFLHQLNPPVCHGDIKSANVLVNSECRALLCDFGLARLYEDSGFGRLETSTGFKGSIRWCSPELLDGKPRTASSDVYAWAWLVWEIMTGELPYEGAGAEYVIIRKIFESPRPQLNGESRLSDCLQLWDLMTRCWEVEPLQRPTSTMCLTTLTELPHCPPAPQSADSQARSPALLETLAELESWKGNYKVSAGHLEQALYLYEEEANDRGIASVLRQQAAVAARRSDYAKALIASFAAIEKFRRLNDSIGEATASFWMGAALLEVDKEEESLHHLQESLNIFRAKGNNIGVVQCLQRLGELHRRKNRPTEAMSTLEEAVDIASRCGARLREADALTILGVTQWDLDDPPKAISTISKARDIAQNIGWDQGLGTALCRLGSMKLAQALYTEAEELLRESVRVTRRSDANWRLAQALFRLGTCLREQERLQEAISVLEESCSVYQDITRTFDEEFAATTAYLADTKATHGDPEGAIVWYDRTIAECRKHQETWYISKYLGEKADFLTKIGRYDEGALHFEASMIIDQERGEGNDADWNRRKLAGVPKTVIKWEVRRRERLALAKVHSRRTTSLLCDVKKLQLRIPQLATPNLKSPVRLARGGGS